MDMTIYKHIKTIGALLAILAFCTQWLVVDGLEQELRSTQPSVSFAIGPVHENTFEILYHQTKDPAFLAKAMNAAGVRFGWLHITPAFGPDTSEERSKLVYAMNAKPKTWEEYTRLHDEFLRSNGKYWDTKWRRRISDIAHKIDIARAVTFLISLIGLLMVWAGESFPSRRRKRRLGGETASGQAQ